MTATCDCCKHEAGQEENRGTDAVESLKPSKAGNALYEDGIRIELAVEKDEDNMENKEATLFCVVHS